MGRFLALVLGTLLILETGCHKATGPVEIAKNPQDSTANAEDTTIIELHYPSLRVAFHNVFMIGHHYYYSNNKVQFDYYDTTLRSSSSSIMGLSWENGPSLLINGTVIKSKNIIPYINAAINPTGSYSFLGLTLRDVAFSYESDSTIYILLNGLDHSNYGLWFSDSYSMHHYPTHSGDFEFIEQEEHKYYKSTDSTRVFITIGYVK